VAQNQAQQDDLRVCLVFDSLDVKTVVLVTGDRLYTSAPKPWIFYKNLLSSTSTKGNDGNFHSCIFYILYFSLRFLFLLFELHDTRKAINII